jgi:hypothetical protein
MTHRFGAPHSAGALLLAVAAWVCALPALAQTTAKQASPQGKAWAGLTVQEQQALLPLKKDWHQLEPVRQRKWLEVASRFGTLPPEERTRIQERMAQWAAMTPAERASARLQFQEAQQLSPSERQARWEAYKALPPEQRSALAQRAKPDAKLVSAPSAARPDTAASAGAKNNLVKLQPQAVRAVSPSIVQAKPGATTTTMATRPSPPRHNQAGLPKIAATPEFVDPATLLPRRGAQAAATVEAAPAVNNDPDKTP